MRILLVEDDELITETLASTLSEQNYVVDVARDGQSGWAYAEASAYDLVLLDVMLPRLDGITLCRQLRSHGYQMPILLLTARDAPADKVKGLDAGADDYVVKPFDPQELTARIRALLRRGTTPLPPVLEWGGLCLNPSTCEVTYNGEPLHLTPKEYSLLELFLRNSNRVFSRSAILDHLWSLEESPGEDTVRAHIKGLRQKLKAVDAPADLIETVYGLGYRLKPLSNESATSDPPQILVAGLSAEFAQRLEQRLDKVSVQVTRSGEETLHELTQNHWSMLIIDHQLSAPAAVEVLRLMSKKLSNKAKIPILYCLEAGMDSKIPSKLSAQLLFHPFEDEKLAQIVAQTLDLPLRELKPAASQMAHQMKAAVAKVWERFKDRIFDRVSVLEETIAAIAAGTLSEELRLNSIQEAHKLAGSLGTFGLTQGSVLAKELEQLLQKGTSFDAEETLHLSKLVTQLRFQLDVNPNESQPSPEADQNLPLVLVVDADSALGDRVVSEANRWGMEAITATNLTAAKAAIARQIPNVVLLDLSVPTVADPGENSEKISSSAPFCNNDALNFLAELANRTPPVPVLVSTAKDAFTNRLEVARLGGRAFLQKPIPPVQVMELISRILQRVSTTEAKVLIVDDDPQMLATLRALLAPWGLRALTLENPLQFWDTLESMQPDLLILDVEMPHLSGIELCQVVRNDPRWGGLPILFLTAHTDAATVYQVFAAGADDYVSKPVVGPELVTRILTRLERSQLLRSMAETDGLTGVANRRKSTQTLNQFLSLAERHKEPLCFAVVDLDYFKQVNDRYGHAAGDWVLRRLGEILRRAFRSEDVVARWGGEEFVIGMYAMSKHDGVKRIEEVLDMLHQEKFIHSDNTEFSVTFSGGVAQYPEDGTDLPSLYRAADKAMYQAKARGRDRIFAAQTPETSV